MSRLKWIKWAVVQISFFILIFLLSRKFGSETPWFKSANYFYNGFTLITFGLIIILLYISMAKRSLQVATRVWMGFAFKYIGILVLIIVYVLRGGLNHAEEALPALLLYIVYSWLYYSMLAGD